MNSLSPDGLDRLKAHEGLELEAYDDSTGVMTIGYGHTGSVQAGDRITEQQAAQLLAHDTDWAEQAVNDNVKVPLTQDKFDALVSFTYNAGEGAFENSTLLKKINAGDHEGAQAEFHRWNKDGDGRVMEGLARRRADEAALFGGESPTADSGEQALTQAPLNDATVAGATAYVVQPGDTLFEIAQSQGVTLEALLKANPQISDPDVIYPGDQIRMPQSDGGGTQEMPSATSEIAWGPDAQQFNALLEQALSFDVQLVTQE